MKDFKEHFYLLLNKFKADENFAFLRFSDGEMHLLMNRSLKIGDTWYEINGARKPGNYDKVNFKDVDPVKHKFFFDALKDSFQYHEKNYYVGLSCRCCVGEENFKWQVNFRGGDDDCLTWANLLINGNYERFTTEMLPLFKDKKVVFICNEKMDISKLPFPVVKDFRIGQNCMVNNFNLSDEIIVWMKENNIKNHLFLFSASSLSEVLIHKLFIVEKENTYIDIGTMFNLYMGIDYNRGYLLKGATLNKICIW